MGIAGRNFSEGDFPMDVVYKYLPPVMPLLPLVKSHPICLIQTCYQLLPETNEGTKSEYQNFRNLYALVI